MYDEYYQIKDYNTGYHYTTNEGSCGSCWQRSQNALPALSESTKMRTTMMTGGSFNDTYISRNGAKTTANKINPGHGAIIHSPLSLGSIGGDEFSEITIPELITYDRRLDDDERIRVDSYMAIKYGITLGGTHEATIDYKNSSTATIWSVSTNTGYNYDVAGIGRDDISTLDQRKSHSINGFSSTTYSDIITIANGENFDSPSSFTTDQSFLVWGHNGEPTESLWPEPVFTTQNSEDIEAVMQRHWKVQKTGDVKKVTVEIDMSNIPGPNGVAGSNDLNNIRILISPDAVFNNHSFAIVPQIMQSENKVRFSHEFTAGNNVANADGLYFTIASTNYKTTPLPIELTEFSGECQATQNIIRWTTASEKNVHHFEIERSRNGMDWEFVGKQKAQGNSQTTHHYMIVDDTKFPLTYYRLTNIDYDAEKKTFGPISVQCNPHQETWEVYPNPLSGNGSIQINSETNFETNIQIMDISGKRVYHQDIKVKKGSQLISFDASHLSSGIYLVKMNESTRNYKPLKLVIH